MNSRRSTLTNNLLEKCCESYIFKDKSIDEFSGYFDESDEFQNNTTALTSQFKISQVEQMETIYFIL